MVDLDICGPSIPKLLAVEGEKVVDSPYGWIPLRYIVQWNPSIRTPLN